MLVYRLLELFVLGHRVLERLGIEFDIPPNKSLLQSKNQGILPRSGQVEGFEYNFHGKGCLFELSTGEIIDVDLSPLNIALFDKHRICVFLESRGHVLPVPQLDEALLVLLDRGILFEGPEGWFSFSLTVLKL